TATPACCTAPNQNSAAFAAVIHANAIVTPDTLRDLAAHDGVRRGRRPPFDGRGQRESGRDQPREAREGCQRDQEQRLWEDQIQPTQFADDSERDARDDDPFREELQKRRWDRDAGDQYAEWDGESGTTKTLIEPVQGLNQCAILRDARMCQ